MSLPRALRLAGAGVDGSDLVRELARDDLEIGELADERVGDRLEDIGSQRGLVGAGDLHRVAVLVLGGLGARLPRGGQVVDQRVEEHVDAFERGRGAAEHGGDGAVVDAVVDALEDFVAGELLAREELLEQLLVRLGDRLADGGGQALEAVLDVGHRDLGGLALGVVLVGLVVDQVDVALDLVVLDDRHDERADRRPERALELLEHLVEVGVLRCPSC